MAARGFLPSLSRVGRSRVGPGLSAPPAPPRSPPPPLPPLLRPPPSPPPLLPPPARRPPPASASAASPAPGAPLRPGPDEEPPGGLGRALWELGPRGASEAQRRRALLQARQFVEAAARGHRFYREALRPALEQRRLLARQLQHQRQAAYRELLRQLLRQERGEAPESHELLAPLQALERTLPGPPHPPPPGPARGARPAK